MTRNIELVPEAFASRLRALREAAGLTRAELAQRAGLTYRTILNLETGKVGRAQEKTLLLLVEVLQVDRNELLKGEELSESNSSSDDSTPAKFHHVLKLSPLALLAIGLVWLLWTPPRLC